jgi:hypothetical protein
VLQVRSHAAPPACLAGPSALFKLGERYTGSSLRIPMTHQACFQIPALGRLIFVLPRGAEMPCTIDRGSMYLRKGWLAISAELKLRPGSTLQLQQERRRSHRFHIAKLSAVAAAAALRSGAAAAAAAAVPAAPAGGGTEADQSADQQQSAQPDTPAAAASEQPVMVAAEPEGHGPATMRVKLPETYAGRHCTLSASMRPQLEALLPGSSSIRPFNLVLPSGKQLPVAYVLSNGRIQRGWPAVHRALKLRAGIALYFWQTAQGHFCIAKKRAAAAATHSGASALLRPPAHDVLQQSSGPSQLPDDQVLRVCHVTLPLEIDHYC